jgi:hypothetical protein
LIELQAKLDALDDGSDETRRIAHELQTLLTEVRQALGRGTQH